MNLRVSVYTNSHYISPSSYYRINQYVDRMTNEPFEIDKHYAQRDALRQWYLAINRNQTFKHRVSQLICYIDQYVNILYALLKDNFFFHPDVVIVLRAIISRKSTPLIVYLLNRLVRKTILLWDYDDNIFESKEIDSKIKDVLMKHAYRIIVTSKFLRNQLPTLQDDKFIYLPTSDGDMYKCYCSEVIEKRKQRFENELAIVWVATAVNMPFLKKVIPALELASKQIQQKCKKKVILEVVCNATLEADTVYSLEIHNIKWNRNVATERMLKAHIGIMPLEENEFTKGKGGFKLIQYMSVGLPVIASNVGYNREVIGQVMEGGFLLDSFDEWTGIIINMASDFELLNKMGIASRKAWKQYFSYEFNYQTWVELIKSGLDP